MRGSYQLRESHLKQTTGSECQTLQIGEPWLSSSLLSCYVKCALLYPHTCQSIVYDTDNQVCTPGSVAFGPLENVNTAIPDKESRDKIVYAMQPIPPCDINSGNFSLYSVCGTTLCLHLSTSGEEYQVAASRCKNMKSRLFVGKTLPRFSVFWHVSLNFLNTNTWIGLTDLEVEGRFVWDDGEQLSDEMAQWIWRTGYPDNSFENEHCGEARLKNWPGVYGLNDANCIDHDFYICELFG
ncbi:hypothetical protein EGW08_020566 [Elysia chlorotica]|uniref:C-type lectin domain-containing protein n=1 Tax=Elysia chlorotica TaxID=188477 RepID=A0A3S1ATI0_ELYCH|nr:hypothetical protein EGW08_020566 [Elysia chlorotica]